MTYRIALIEHGGENDGKLITYVGDSRKHDKLLLSIAGDLNIVFDLRDIPIHATVSPE